MASWGPRGAGRARQGEWEPHLLVIDQIVVVQLLLRHYFERLRRAARAEVGDSSAPARLPAATPAMRPSQLPLPS
jgi:hypothetical protein